MSEEECRERAASMPRIGDKAPDFEIETTQGVLRLEDFKGSWLILFSHPADFTPVCTTEFVAFAKLHPALRERNCELLGVSVDSIFSHIAWIRSIEEKFGIKIDFPVAADLNKEIAGKYGMVMPGESGTETVRAVFVIDDSQIVRAIVYYPLTTGREPAEFLRLVTALQTTDKHGVATPAGWRPGDPVIAPPPRTAELAAERAAEGGPDCKDWYFCLKNLK